MVRKISLLSFLLSAVLTVFATLPAAAQATATTGAPGSVSDTYSADELVEKGSEFFGSVAQGLASLVERAVSQFGLPNAYILGQEGSGAIIAGARYGEGTMYTRNAGDRALFWQGSVARLRRRR